MNNLETAIPFMQQLEELLRSKSIELNAKLSNLEIRGVDFEEQLTRINEQIKSAETKYTIAFVGTFKAGKSTIINSLLGLKKDSERLSSEYDPDTAQCIRLMRKPKGQKYDAEVRFEDTYETEYMDWEEAKKYTSQVAIEASSAEFKNKTEKIDEIRYYIDNPFLDVCNILDLPGTGTGEHPRHTIITDRKGMEADCIFWVVSTHDEPDRQTIMNLEKFNTKMLPIINVWQIESENIQSFYTPEEMKEMLLGQFGAYFASAEDPVLYYAGEIDLAQRESRELKEEWGKSAFTDKVEEILSNIQAGDRMQRIKKYISTSLQECDIKLKEILEDNALKTEAQTEKNESLEINKIRSRLYKAKELGTSEIRDHARKTAQDIINIFSDASDAFIENQMQSINFGALFKRQNFQDELKRDFEKNYVRIKSGWLDKAVKEFSNDIINILKGIYIDFSTDISTVKNRGSFSMNEDDLSGFIDDMTKMMGNDMVERIAPAIIAAIAGGIMMAIPGGLTIEALATVVTSGVNAAIGITNDSKLRSKTNGVKNAAKVQIKQQRYIVVNDLSESGQKVNEDMYKKVSDELDKRSNINERNKAQLKNLENMVKDMIAFVNEQSEELAKI